MLKQISNFTVTLQNFSCVLLLLLVAVVFFTTGFVYLLVVKTSSLKLAYNEGRTENFFP